MSYKRADHVLPKELMEQIQKYVDGDYLYIPRLEENRKKWGDNTKTRTELAQRNEAICEEFHSGIPINVLAQKYFLSEKSIHRIVYKKDIPQTA